MKEIKVPEYSGKVSAEQLQELARLPLNVDSVGDETPAFFSANDSGFEFDFLWHPKKGSKKLFILFSGDADRQKYDPPVFQRWSWAKLFPGHCLFVSDPALYLEKTLGLAWYTGTSTYDPLSFISYVVQGIADRMSISSESVVSYGSSGGGFAALRLGTVLPGMVVVCINPQTVVTNYRLQKVEKLLRVCFNGMTRVEALNAFPGKLSIDVENLVCSKLIYAQNTMDTHHHEEHFKPFVEALDSKRTTRPLGWFETILFAHEGGHLKAETSDVFSKIMSLVEA